MSPEQYGTNARFQSRNGLRWSPLKRDTVSRSNDGAQTVLLPRSVFARAVQSLACVQRPPPLRTTIQPLCASGVAPAGAGRRYKPNAEPSRQRALGNSLASSMSNGALLLLTPNALPLRAAAIMLPANIDMTRHARLGNNTFRGDPRLTLSGTDDHRPTAFAAARRRNFIA
eukprot:6704536-Prymnesium_polylepis.3